MIVFIVQIKQLLGSTIAPIENEILDCISFEMSVSQFARKFSEVKKVPLSTVWHNLCKLRTKGIITFSPFSRTELLDVINEIKRSNVQQETA